MELPKIALEAWGWGNDGTLYKNTSYSNSMGN